MLHEQSQFGYIAVDFDLLIHWWKSSSFFTQFYIMSF